MTTVMFDDKIIMIIRHRSQNQDKNILTWDQEDQLISAQYHTGTDRTL